MTMSERQEQRRIERTAGTGIVARDGIQLGTMSYLLEIWQTFHIIRGFGAGPDEEVEGLQEIKIRVLRHDLDTLQVVAGRRDAEPAARGRTAVRRFPER
jgi:hypothetical protein